MCEKCIAGINIIHSETAEEAHALGRKPKKSGGRIVPCRECGVYKTNHEARNFVVELLRLADREADARGGTLMDALERLQAAPELLAEQLAEIPSAADKAA